MFKWSVKKGKPIPHSDDKLHWVHVNTGKLMKGKDIVKAKEELESMMMKQGKKPKNIGVRALTGTQWISLDYESLNEESIEDYYSTKTKIEKQFDQVFQIVFAIRS